jgi:DNA-binding IclR family transcriptional regulator
VAGEAHRARDRAAIAPPTGIELRSLADKLNLDKSNVSRRLARAADGGYVRNLEDKRGKPGRWVIGDPLPETADLLPDPAQLRNTEQLADRDRCGVAVDPDRERAEVAEVETARACAGVWTDGANTNCQVFAACVLADTAPA